MTRELNNKSKEIIKSLLLNGKIYKYGGVFKYRFYHKLYGKNTPFSEDVNQFIKAILKSVLLIPGYELLICEKCGKVFLYDNSLIDYGINEIICEECLHTFYQFCKECGKYHLNADMFEAGDFGAMCRNCIKNYARCNDCHKWFKVDDMIGNLCKTCHSLKPTIMSYHEYRSNYEYVEQFALHEPISFNTFGIELEVVGNIRTSSFISENMGNIFHMERDSSVRDGYEIISQPLSMKRWFEIRNDFKNVLGYLIKNGVRSHDTDCCGLHIHVNRKAFKNRTAINKAILIVNAFANNMQKLGRRFNSRYSSFNKNCLKNIETKRLNTSFYSSERYSCVNCYNTNTIEFRFPKGTLNLSTIYATIELINNIVEMANSDVSIVRFEELIKGHFLPKYAKTRNVNMYEFIDLKDFSLKNLKITKLRDVMNMNVGYAECVSYA